MPNLEDTVIIRRRQWQRKRRNRQPRGLLSVVQLERRNNHRSCDQLRRTGRQRKKTRELETFRGVTTYDEKWPREIKGPFYRRLRLSGRIRGALDEKEFREAMADTRELVSTFLEFEASDLSRDERDIQWIPPLTEPPSAEIQDDAFTRSRANVLGASTGSLAFPILGDNHFSLAFEFGMQDARIRSGTYVASSGNCPVRQVHLDGLADVGHFRHVSQIIYQWLRKYLPYMCLWRGMELKLPSQADSGSASETWGECESFAGSESSD